MAKTTTKVAPWLGSLLFLHFLGLRVRVLLAINYGLIKVKYRKKKNNREINIPRRAYIHIYTFGGWALGRA